MMLHSDPLFGIAFGDKQSAFDPNQFKSVSNTTSLLTKKQFIGTKKLLQLDALVAPQQTHGTDGLIIQTPKDVVSYKPYSSDADFVVTNLSNVGIGVATADCLPIIFYDSSRHVIAVTHAGWQGSLNGVAVKTVQAMQKHFGTKLEYLKVFFGPCAKVGTYKVGPEFAQYVAQCPFKKEILVTKKDEFYFNLPLYNQRLLEKMGINKAAFKLDYNICTITNNSFCSHRRDGKKAQRQMTIAALK